MDLRLRIGEVLDKAHLMSLATVDNSGVWVADVIFIYDDNFNLYWMSDPHVRHSQAIIKNKNVAGAITVSNKAKEQNLGIQFHGAAEKIEGARHDLAVKHLAKRGHPPPKDSDDILQGHSWYILKPELIQLIDEENFGFNKQTLEF